LLLARRLSFVLLALMPFGALADRATTQDALARLEESLSARVEDGVLSEKNLTPAIVVSAQPAYEETRAWYPTAAVISLSRVFGASGLRACEACMTARLHVEEGRLEQDLTSPGIAEIIRIDENSRGTAAPAKTAIWADETPSGVSLRIVDLSNGRIVYAENFDPVLAEPARSRKSFNMTRELERRSRGDAITHTLIDIAIYPGQHFSLDFVEQWGDSNHNLSGLTLSLFDPVVGLGGAYYRVLPKALGITVGAKIIMSLPTAFVLAVTGNGNTQLINPLLTAVAVVRVPIATSNYAVVATASTNGQIGIGISLMNFSLLPVIP
jgi:hypothetical protein